MTIKQFILIWCQRIPIIIYYFSCIFTMIEETQAKLIKIIQLYEKHRQIFQSQLKKLSEQQVDHFFHMFTNSLKQTRKSTARTMMQIWTSVSQVYPINTNKYKFDELLMQNLVKHMEANNTIDEAVLLIEELFINKDYSCFANQAIFCVLIRKFMDTKDENKPILTQIIVQMTSTNKKLIQFMNNPYHFLEYFIHLINLQNNPDKLGYWIKTVKQLYWSAPSEECLFHITDFLTLIDIIVSIMQNCSQVSVIRLCLQCYLVLSCCDRIINKGVFYRLSDLKNKISLTNMQELGLKELAEEICSIDGNGKN